MATLDIGRRLIGEKEPTYFVADISANHDGSLERAKMLIHLAAESGADAAKFQHFRASGIVSQRGFEALGSQRSHQAKWRKKVYQVYTDAALPWEWTATLKAECDKARIDFFSAPYDFEAVDMLDPYVPVFKVGSGDITWPEMLRKIAGKHKPVFLACGASDIGEVQQAAAIVLSINPQLCLMQCNTNYTASTENFRFVNLNVLKAFGIMFPDLVLGLSDHTPGHAAVLGAVAFGARVIEKHFTDDNSREGPDHPFSMTPGTWREMVDRTRELELALGSTLKRVTENEEQTVIVQRRCIRAARDLPAGTVLTRDLLDVLRPAPRGAIFPYDIERVVGTRLSEAVVAGDHIEWTMLDKQ
jgi:sialic acid synthase SpsE